MYSAVPSEANRYRLVRLERLAAKHLNLALD